MISRRGLLVPIGGAEDKQGDSVILRRFVEACGSERARIAIIPTASRRRDTGRRYEGVFSSLGAASAQTLRLRSREDCHDRALLERLEDSNGVFLTGGSQTRLMRVLGGTPIARLLHDLVGRGAHIAGTSAGAAVLSERMIAFGESGESPRLGMVAIRDGLGLTSRLIVDQHFNERDRLGRLITAVASHPERIGLGLDEDTAAFIDSRGRLEIVGSGSATIVRLPDHSGSLTDVRLHILTDGATYDLETLEIRSRRS